jgi:hypothetical protein
MMLGLVLLATFLFVAFGSRELRGKGEKDGLVIKVPYQFSRTNASPHHCLTSTLPHFTIASLHHCLTSPLPHFTIASLHHCLTSPMPHLTNASPHQCLTSPMPHLTNASPHPFVDPIPPFSNPRQFFKPPGNLLMELLDFY